MSIKSLSAKLNVDQLWDGIWDHGPRRVTCGNYEMLLLIPVDINGIGT